MAMIPARTEEQARKMMCCCAPSGYPERFTPDPQRPHISVTHYLCVASDCMGWSFSHENNGSGYCSRATGGAACMGSEQ